MIQLHYNNHIHVLCYLYMLIIVGVDIEALLEAINFEDHQYRPKTALTWQEHQTEQRLSWQTNRQNVVAAYVSFLPHTKRACDNCFSLDTASQSIRCLTCRQHLCWKCDLEKHVSDPFHRRILVNKLLNENMKPTQFFKKDWQAVEQGKIYLLFIYRYLGHFTFFHLYPQNYPSHCLCPAVVRTVHQ